MLLNTEYRRKMQKKVLKTYTPAFKAQVALAAFAGEHDLRDLSKRYGAPVQLIVQWKQQLSERADKVFSSSTVDVIIPSEQENPVKIAGLKVSEEA